MNPLATLWRRLFPAPQVAPEVAQVIRRAQVDWGRMIAEAPPPPPRIELPTWLPGVVPATEPAGVMLALDSGGKETTRQIALDSWNSIAGGLGTGALGPGLAFLGFPYLAELAQITEYRTPAESLSTEMTRRWMRLKFDGKKKQKKTHLSKAAQDRKPESEPEIEVDDDAQDDEDTEKIKQIDKRLEELNVRGLFREAALKTEQFGRAHIYVSVKGQDTDDRRQTPLTEIGKGQLLGLRCIEPYWLTPYSWNSTHPEREDFYRPQSWYVLGRKTHATRLCTFVFREVPDLLKPAYDFSGISITQLMMPYVNRWLRTAKNVNDLINIFSIVTLSTDLQSLLQDPQAFRKRLNAFTTMRDNRGLLAINKGTEELAINNVTLSSLDKLQAQAQEHMATPARMPLIKFFGITPTGLNSTSDGEFQSWYDYAHGMQELGFTPHMQRILELVQMDLFGSVDPDITFEWLSLYEPTPKELSELRKADADRDVGLVNAGVVSPDEVREKMRRDPESAYGDLEGDAPEPPAIQEMRAGAEEQFGAEQQDPEDGDNPPAPHHGRVGNNQYHKRD